MPLETSTLCQVSSVELERVCVEGVPSVLEAAAVGVPAPGGGPEQLVLFLVPSQRGGSRREAADAARARARPPSARASTRCSRWSG